MPIGTVLWGLFLALTMYLLPTYSLWFFGNGLTLALVLHAGSDLLGLFFQFPQHQSKGGKVPVHRVHATR